MKANENPFRSSKVEQIRYALNPVELTALSDQILAQACSCLLGPKGTGKTTLMEDLEPYVRARGYQTHWVRLNLESTRTATRDVIGQLSSLGQQDICLFDGAEVLNWWQSRKLRRAAIQQGFKLVATLHQKRGVSVALNTRADWNLAKRFVEQIAGDHYTSELNNRAKCAFDNNQGNMREVFRSCYLYLAQV